MAASFRRRKQEQPRLSHPRGDSPSKYNKTGGRHKDSVLTLQTVGAAGPWPAPSPELHGNLAVFPGTARGAGEQKRHKTASSNTLQNSLQK